MARGGRLRFVAEQGEGVVKPSRRSAVRFTANAAVIGACLIAPNTWAQGRAEQPKSLTQLRAAIREYKASAGSHADSFLELAGYSFDWELTTGGEFTVVVISRNLGGQLAIFSKDGLLATFVPTGETISVQLCDLDDDGIAEIITDEEVGRGTGLLTRDFRVYRASSTAIKRLWGGESFSYLIHLAPEKSYESSSRGYLRCDPSGGGHPRPRLLYDFESRDGQGKVVRRSAIFELQGETLVERAPENKPK